MRSAILQGTDPVYMPFPGYNNIDDNGQIIDMADNDGRSDSFHIPIYK